MVGALHATPLRLFAAQPLGFACGSPPTYETNPLPQVGEGAMTTLTEPYCGYLTPSPTKNVSAERSREALGLMCLTTRNRSLNSLTSWL